MKSFEEVLKEVYADAIAIAKANQEVLNKVEEVVFRSGGFRSTNEELSQRRDNSADGEEK